MFTMLPVVKGRPALGPLFGVMRNVLEDRMCPLTGIGKRGMRGVGATELIIGVVLLLILLILVIPVVWDISINVKRDEIVGELRRAIVLARSEALRRNRSVAICPSVDEASCLPGNQPNWNRGWVIFVDSDGDRERDPGEELLRVFSFWESGYSLTGSNGLQRGILFKSDGYPDSSGDLTYCEKEGDSPQQHRLELNAMGRIDVSSGAGGCP